MKCDDVIGDLPRLFVAGSVGLITFGMPDPPISSGALHARG